MSATIIRIMTSSSTSKTEQPKGRVAIMMESLPFRASTFAKIAPRRNAGLKLPGAAAMCFSGAATSGWDQGSLTGTGFVRKFFLNPLLLLHLGMAEA
jgi:hypothetical protein